MRIAHTLSNANEIVLDGRSVVVDAFPMGIDYEKYKSQCA